ncbi:transposase [Nostoc sp.]|uniref:transposase n=1 Tax=Nostoc sp. TaxID=1180 RepID=UPI002FFA20BC
MRVARAAFPKGNLYMTMRDEIGTLYNDQDFEDLFPTLGQPAFSPWRLALVCVMQYIEDMTDRQAFQLQFAVELIGSMHFLSYLTDSGFDFSVLCEFRVRLISGSAEQKLLDILLKQFKEKGIIKDRGKQRTDSTQQEENSSNILEDQLFNLKSQDLRNFFTKLGLVIQFRNPVCIDSLHKSSVSVLAHTDNVFRGEVFYILPMIVEPVQVKRVTIIHINT